MNEFDIIKKYFMKHKHHQTISVKNGDDCAILNPPKNTEIAMSLDTLVYGIHFDDTTSARDLGYKSLSVNLSDLAAMGTTPAWVMLSLTLPEIDESFLSNFQQGFFEHFTQYPLALIGGDITRGPMSVTVQVSGFSPTNTALKRSGAQVEDRIYVTNSLGDAAIALQYLQKKISLSPTDAAFVLEKLYRPTPRIHDGIALRNLASSAIDISDGLYADLSHILQASNVGANLFIDEIPISTVLAKQNQHTIRTASLFGGDAYELCFTAPKHVNLSLLKSPATCIGEITANVGIQLIDNENKIHKLTDMSYKHF